MGSDSMYAPPLLVTSQQGSGWKRALWEISIHCCTNLTAIKLSIYYFRARTPQTHAHREMSTSGSQKKGNIQLKKSNF